jgi:hypothetical protein
MTRHFSTSLSLVLFSAGSIRREGDMDERRFRTAERPRPVSIVGQITEEVTDAAAAPTPHVTPAIRVISVFQRHLLNPEHKEMMEKVLFQ